MPARTDRILRLVALVAGLGAGWLALALPGEARSRPDRFQPIRQLPGWYADRAPIDVEIPVDDDRATPPLRLRVERAAIAGFAEGFVSFGLDVPSGLPNALFVARARGAGPSTLPRLPHRELIARLMTLDLVAAERATALADLGRRLAPCRGAEIAPALFDFDFERAPSCRPLAGDDRIARFVGLHGDDLVEITCAPPRPGPEALGCRLRFPFEGLAVRMAFNGRHLLRWSSLVDQAIAFLETSRYRGET